MSKQAIATPGPWTVDTDDLGTWINTPSMPQPIAKMGTCTHFPTAQNAALIAAAPDLLAACKEYIASGQNMYSRHWEMMKAAIDKAEGRAK